LRSANTFQRGRLPCSLLADGGVKWFRGFKKKDPGFEKTGQRRSKGVNELEKYIARSAADRKDPVLLEVLMKPENVGLEEVGPLEKEGVLPRKKGVLWLCGRQYAVRKGTGSA